MISHNFSIQGHRGCRGLRPENSIPAFKHAIDLGVNTLEMDVVITGDSKVLVSHDPYMNSDFCLDKSGKRIAKKDELQYNIFEMNSDEITGFDCGSLKNPSYPEQLPVSCIKPLLTDVFSEIESYTKEKGTQPVIYNIEIKSKPKWYGTFQPKPEVFTDLVLTDISQFGLLDRVIVQSFDRKVLESLNASFPDITNAILIENYSDPIADIEELSFNPNICGPDFHLVSETLIHYCRSKKIRVIPWTVNEESMMKKLIDMKVDGVITDYPNKLIAIVGHL